MNSGERLIGEHEGLTVDPDGGGGLGSEILHPSNAGAHLTLTATGEDVVSLDDGNEVRGFILDPQGTGGGIEGAAGDTGGGAIDDVRIIDTGTGALSPAWSSTRRAARSTSRSSRSTTAPRPARRADRSACG